MELIKAHRIAAVSVLIIAGSVVLAVLITGTSTIIHDLLHPQYGWLGLLIGAQIIAYAGYAVAYKSLFGLKFKRAAQNTLYGFSPLVALGGFAYDARTSKNRHMVLALGIVEYLLLAPATWVAALVALIWGLHVPLGLSLPWAVVFPIGLGAAIVIVRWRLKIGRGIGLLVDAFYKDCVSLGMKRWMEVILGVGFYWAGQLAALYGALRLFDAPIGLAALILAFASGYVLTQRTSPASFSGLIVILLMLMLHLVGVHNGAAFLATYSFLVVSLLLPIGYLALAHRRITPA